MGPFELYVDQSEISGFFWYVLRRDEEDADTVDVAGGRAPSLVAAMAAAEAAARR
jgi:hypothetical protein